ncbi:unnamed protein product [Heterobilharzia americana]|nr:unnamed protein product [Heterobilharzia americana]
MQQPKKTNRTSFTKPTAIIAVNTTLNKVVALFTFVYMNTDSLVNVTHDVSSLISMHVDNNYGDEFDFDNIGILDGERKHNEYQRIRRSLVFRSISQQSIDV